MQTLGISKSKLPEVAWLVEMTVEVIERMLLNQEMKKFLKELNNLNENCDTIGAGKLANIKEQAQYLLDKLNKE